jgi:hypothetical protein
VLIIAELVADDVIWELPPPLEFPIKLAVFNERSELSRLGQVGRSDTAVVSEPLVTHWTL